MNGLDGKAIHAELTLRGTTLMLGPEMSQGSRSVGGDHPSVTLGIDNGSTAVAPKHIHHGSLGRGAELYGLGNRLVCVLRQQIQSRRRGADCFRIAEPTPKEMQQKMMEQIASQQAARAGSGS